MLSRRLAPALALVLLGVAAVPASARPTDDGDPDAYSASERAALATTCSTDFCFHWTEDAAGDDAPPGVDGDPGTVPDHVNDLITVFQDEVHACQHGAAAGACGAAPGLGWAEPPPDGVLGGDGRVDVYVADLFDDGLFGYAAVDDGQGDDPSQHSYLVMEDDYAMFGFSDPLEPMRVTAAHEYNHVLQNDYDAFQDTWMMEATATWAEEKAYPDYGLWHDVIDVWAEQMALPLTAYPDDFRALKAHGSALWNHWLEGRHGAALIRGAWEHSAAPPTGYREDFAPDAYSAALGRANGFSEEFARFAAAVAEWATPAAGFAGAGAMLPDVVRDGALDSGETRTGELHNTTFALYDVHPTGGRLLLEGSLPAGTRGAIALVGRQGGMFDGTLTTEVTDLPDGGAGSVILEGGFDRVTAVVVNADVTPSGFDPETGERTFARDGQAYSLRAVALRAPAASLGFGGLPTMFSNNLAGTVNPFGDETTYHFEWGRDPYFAPVVFDQRSPEQSAGAGNATVAVSALADGLTPSTNYRFRLVATNRGGTTSSEEGRFTTQGGPPDRTAPLVALKVPPRIRRAALVRRGLSVMSGCSEPCSIAGRLVLDRRSAKRLKLRNRTIATASSALARSGPRTIEFKLTAKARKALRRLRRNGRLTVVVRGTDANGNVAAPVSRGLRLLRR